MSHPTRLPRRGAKRFAAPRLICGLCAALWPRGTPFVASALTSARGQVRLNPEEHPVTLVMEALFGFLPDSETVAMTPPIERTTMLPEPMEFPVHDWLRRVRRAA